MTEHVAAPPTPPEESLARSRRHKVVGGVCGGLGRYFNLDPVIFRVPVALLSVVGGVGLIAYGLAWLLIPFEREEENEGRRLLSGRVEGPGLTALLFIVAGCGLLLATIGDGGGVAWFSVLVFGALAGAASWSRRRGEQAVAMSPRGVAEVVAEAPPEAQAPPAPPGPSWWQGTAERSTGYLWGPADAKPGDYQPTPVPGARRPMEGWPPVQPPARRREWPFSALVLLLALVACGSGTALAWSSEPLGAALAVGLACALAVLGTGMVFSAFRGRLGAGTVASVIVTSVLLGAASVLPDNITTSVTTPTWRVASADQLRSAYVVGSADARLDLTALDVPAGERVSTRVEGGAGQITVLVPADVTVVVRADVTVGAFTYQPLKDEGSPAVRIDDVDGGIDVHGSHTYPPEHGVEAGGTVELDLELGVGHATVRRAAATSETTEGSNP
ncbi:PspC domain-containing protein [Streptomyces millisiae]|uniref:PspC domain-containing protein n=1 Tax=Streptomyces millisiae TaxID=3075542 RepID=A0ABU2LYW9_9ACTN|nr:PspC domain-containing protein [Streptomyces sp. DSM 44918]MDT0322792.1 PspC domain-containing protein [Streptomyces sp. DSM 44918]